MPDAKLNNVFFLPTSEEGESQNIIISLRALKVTY